MTAKSHGLDPLYYLAYVFKHLPDARSIKGIENLLPWNVAGDQMKESFGVFDRGLC